MDKRVRMTEEEPDWKLVRLAKKIESLWYFVFFSSRRRHTRFDCDWSSDVCSSDLDGLQQCATHGRGFVRRFDDGRADPGARVDQRRLRATQPRSTGEAGMLRR